MGYELKRLRLSDTDQLAKAANNEEVARFLRAAFPHPYTLQDAREYISYAASSKDDVILGIFVEGKACGCICARLRGDVYAKSCELGYWLAQEYWGNGVMTSAVKAFCGFIFENYDINRIDAQVFAENAASRRVLEKAGFELEGVHKKKVYKYGEFADELTYALVKD